jgi:hypothetical protein
MNYYKWFRALTPLKVTIFIGISEKIIMHHYIPVPSFDIWGAWGLF